MMPRGLGASSILLRWHHFLVETTERQTKLSKNYKFEGDYLTLVTIRHEKIAVTIQTMRTAHCYVKCITHWLSCTSGALLVQQAKCSLSMEKAVAELKDKLTHHQQEVNSLVLSLNNWVYIAIHVKCMCKWIRNQICLSLRSGYWTFIIIHDPSADS